MRRRVSAATRDRLLLKGLAARSLPGRLSAVRGAVDGSQVGVGGTGTGEVGGLSCDGDGGGEPSVC